MSHSHAKLYISEELPNESRGLLSSGSSLAVCEAASSHFPRDSEKTVLYGAMVEQLETFLARQQQRERPVPRFVERELRLFMDCGILARGFLRVRCDACGKDRLVP